MNSFFQNFQKGGQPARCLMLTKIWGNFLQVISLPFYFPPGSFSVLGGSDLFFGNLINNSRISVLETLPEIFCAFCPHFELLF